jgi:hypothetical protein
MTVKVEGYDSRIQSGGQCKRDKEGEIRIYVYRGAIYLKDVRERDTIVD